MSYQSELTKAGIDTKGHFSGIIKTQCPWCSHTRKKASDPSLSVNIDEGLFKCHHCQKKGSVANVKQYTKPEPKKDAPDSRVTKYFESRGISQETVDAFGVSMSVEWMPQDEEKHKVICFNYYDGDELVNIKFKTSDKKFKMVSGAKKIPYNLNRIKDSTEIIICEGEEEAMVWYQAGYPFAVSCPNGASKGVNNLQWLDDTYSYFENKKIILATDNDGPGQKLKEDLSRRFDQSNVFVIRFPEDAKDANDVLKAYGVEAIKKLYSEAQPIPIKEIARTSDYIDDVVGFARTGYPRGETVAMVQTDKHLTWNKGELVVLTGVPGCFDKDQLIHTKRGVVPISEVKVGDHVLSYNEERDINQWKYVLATPIHKTTPDRMFKITLKDGTIIKVTENHEFYTGAGYVKIKDFIVSLLNGEDLEKNT